MSKKVTFGAKRPSAQVASNSIDEWVTGQVAGDQEPEKRLTITIPLSLHKRVKSGCAIQNLIMADVVRELLEKRFPNTSEHGEPS
jgi:hypothetical protein